MSNQITSEELLTVIKFSKSELQKVIQSLELLIKQNGNFDASLNRDIIENTSNIILFLPQIKHMYLGESVKPFKQICLLIGDFVEKNPTHQFNRIFLEVINTISQHFKTFNVSEDLSDLSLTPLSNEDTRPLVAKVINPNFDDSQTYRRMIKDMVKTSGARYESNKNWKALADGIKATYEGEEDIDKTKEVTNDLLLQSVNRLHQRETEAIANRQKFTIQHLSTNEESEKEAKKKRRETLLNAVADGIITKSKSSSDSS